MSDDERWAVLQSTRDGLRAETDRLNESITKVEIALRDLGIGVGASVTLFEYTDGETKIKWRHALGFGKLDGVWRLTFEVSSNFPDNPDETVEPLGNASRQMRVIASNHLDKLLDALGVAAERQRLQVSEAASRFDTFAASIPKTRVRPPPKSTP